MSRRDCHINCYGTPREYRGVRIAVNHGMHRQLHLRQLHNRQLDESQRQNRMKTLKPQAMLALTASADWYGRS
jgi:hypothetical protein